MKKTFICLANSYKESGRCIAGIEVNGKEIILQKGEPKWIRPVCKTEHGQVPTYLVSNIKLLDVIEIDEVVEASNGYQSENILFERKSIKAVGRYSFDKLPELCNDSQTLIFGNKDNRVSEEDIENLDHSLRMICVKKFEIYQKKDFNGVLKPRLGFKYKSNLYDLPITEPSFYKSYEDCKKNLSGRIELYLTLSLGLIFKGSYYKLIAGIL